jgi:hypothetical protein
MRVGFPEGGWKLTIEGPGAATLNVSKCEVDHRALVFFDAHGAKAWESSLVEITDLRITTPHDSPDARERPTIPHGPQVVEIRFNHGVRASLSCRGSTDMESLTAARRFRKVIEDARQDGGGAT